MKLLIQTLLALSLLLSLSVSGANDISSLMPPKSTAELNTWCTSFNRHMIDECYRHDGNELVCQDAVMRIIIKQMGGVEAACERHPTLGMSEKQCTSVYGLYMKHCPIVTKLYPANQPSYAFYNLGKSIAEANIDKKPTHVAASNRHVLLIGLDGVRGDAFQLTYQRLKKEGQLKTFTQFIDRNGIYSNYYAGGEQNKPTQQATLSEPGWVTILTGVWANQHHIKSNKDIEQGKFNHVIPTLYNRIKEKFPSSLTASFSDWKPIAMLAGYAYNKIGAADINQLYLPNSSKATVLTEQQMTQQIVRLIQSNNPPIFTFVHYNSPDLKGHINGFSTSVKPYLKAIKQVAINVDSLLHAIDNNKNEHWLVVMTTDHGGHNKIHGSQSHEDRTIFASIGMNDGIINKSKQPQGQTTFAKIIMNYLDRGSIA